MKNYLGLLIVLLFTACSSKEEFVLFNNNMGENVTVQKPSPINILNPSEKVKFEYKIMPHDRISVIVYKHPEFSTTTIGAASEDRGILVDSQGDISLPLIDDVHIAGLTQKEARQKIEKKFFNYLNYSKVKLEVLNKRAYIIGEVKRPGELELINEKSSLLKMIAKAGDLTDYANRQNIIILREVNEKATARCVNLVDLHSISLANLTIYPNDIIYVPPKDMKSFNLKIGEYDPLFRLVGHILTPFINIKYLTD